MASRHLSRALVLQTLFECDMHSALDANAAHEILNRNAAELAQGDTDKPFAESLLASVLGKREEIDTVMGASAPQWPVDKIAPIDRNILRIGLYELLFGDRNAVPPKVALNEAIELAKTYGGDSSGKFINGVLGAVYRDIGEPGKMDVPKDSVPMKHESLGGVLLYASQNGELKIALVKDAFGRWTLPKAKCHESELTESAAKRAMKDELGVEGEIESPLGENEYIAHEPELGRIARTVSYFLASTGEARTLHCKVCEGIQEARWFSESQLGSIPLYEDLTPLIELGVKTAKRS